MTNRWNAMASIVWLLLYNVPVSLPDVNPYPAVPKSWRRDGQDKSLFLKTSATFAYASQPTS
jgi:hypothetical protein